MKSGHSTPAAIRVAVGYLSNFYEGRTSRAATCRHLSALAAYAEDAGDADVADLAATTSADLQVGNLPVMIHDGERIGPPEDFQEAKDAGDNATPEKKKRNK